MAPEVDFSQFSQDDIDKILDAGQEKAGYESYHHALSIALRNSMEETSSKTDKSNIIDIPDSDKTLLEQVVGREVAVHEDPAA